MKSNKAINILKVIWKWISFSAWLIWFFLTFPWQIKKGYNQFVNATTIEFPKARRSSKLISGVSPRYFDNLN